MEKGSELFVGLDTSKLKISIAVAEGERNGEVRFFGDISAEPASVAAMVAAKLAKRGAKLHFCYEAGPTGYELYRQILELGHHCDVVAPSLTLGHLMFGKRSDQAGGGPSLFVGALCELGPDYLDGGKPQFVEDKAQALSIDVVGFGHAASPSSRAS
jgi:hypothetical protein